MTLAARVFHLLTLGTPPLLGRHLEVAFIVLILGFIDTPLALGVCRCATRRKRHYDSSGLIGMKGITHHNYKKNY